MAVTIVSHNIQWHLYRYICIFRSIRCLKWVKSSTELSERYTHFSFTFLYRLIYHEYCVIYSPTATHTEGETKRGNWNTCRWSKIYRNIWHDNPILIVRWEKIFIFRLIATNRPLVSNSFFLSYVYIKLQRKKYLISRLKKARTANNEHCIFSLIFY